MLRPTKPMKKAFQYVSLTRGLMAVVTASALVLALTVYASGHKDSTRLGVFSRHLRMRTQFAHASSLTGPSVRAGTFGKAEVYLSENKGHICIRVLEGSTGGGASCGEAEEVEKEGTLSISTDGLGDVGVYLVLPNSVERVTLLDRGGGSRELRAVNNVAGADDPQVDAVSYTLPNGEPHTIGIPAEVLKPQPPR